MSKKGLLDIDWTLLIPTGILVIISLVTLLPISFDYFRNKLAFVIISVFAFFFFSLANNKLLKFYTKPIYLISLVLLILVFFVGVESRGSVRWIEFLGFRVQFSEILKPFLSISLAGYLIVNKGRSLKSFLNVFLFLSPIFFLILIQPDLGNALIYLGILFATIIYLGFPLRYFLSIFLPALLISPMIWNFLHDYQKQRVLTFLNPGKDPLGTSYNIIQSVIAVGSGMIMGKGLGQGTQSSLRFLPERHTDFIFATISEQLGFIGGVIILVCFMVILYRIYKIYDKSNDNFCKLFSVIVFFSFLIQMFVNMGMNIGILPIVGVTLPFVSYGGSSLLSNFIFLGLLSSISKSSKDNDVLEIR